MKRNALIRIILWSVVLGFLLYALLGLIYSMHWKKTSIHAADATEIAYPLTETAYAVDEVNVRSSPTMDAQVIGLLHSGVPVEILYEDSVEGVRWAFLTSPMEGWVQSEYIQTPRAPAETEVYETVAEDPTGDTLVFEADQVKKLEIEWAAGDILIQPTDSNQITVSESRNSKKQDPLVWKLNNGELSIEFTGEDDFFSLPDLKDHAKDLTLYVPRDWICMSLEVDAASATLEVNGLTVTEVEFDGASGRCEFRDCNVERMDVDTASGDIRFFGSLQHLEVDAASANVQAVLTNIPSRIHMDSMSGDLDVTLPEDAGFTLTMEGLSTSFHTDFTTENRNGDILCGDGSCRIHLNAMSGDVFLRKAAPNP